MQSSDICLGGGSLTLVCVNFSTLVLMKMNGSVMLKFCFLKVKYISFLLVLSTLSLIVIVTIILYG